MGESETIVIPYEMKSCSVKILSPHCKPYRQYDFCDGVPLDPIVETLKIAKMLPLPTSIMQRIETMPWRVDVKHGRYSRMDLVESDRRAGERKMKDGINCLKRGDYKFVNCYPHTEYLLTKILTPDDFTFEQKVELFDYYSDMVVRGTENEFISSLGKSPYTHSPVYLVSDNCTLEEWRKSRRERADSALKRWLEAQTAIRDLGGYDWHPLDFIFGEQLPTLVQLKTAALQAEMKLSYDTVMREYRDFLDAVDKASQLGAMRANTTQLDSMLLGRYKVWLYIRDSGKGAEFVGAVNQSMEPVKDVASIVSSTFKFLFGEKK